MSNARILALVCEKLRGGRTRRAIFRAFKTRIDRIHNIRHFVGVLNKCTYEQSLSVQTAR